MVEVIAEFSDRLAAPGSPTGGPGGSAIAGKLYSIYAILGR